jgi:ubiquinone/menaquinone biosynthesis C-methylase UbiE
MFANGLTKQKVKFNTYTDLAAAQRYRAARALPPETLALWMDKLKVRVPPGPIRKILDMGCGDGRFSLALGQAYDCPVVAVDPSVAMLERGKALAEARIEWLEGSAEAIPQPDHTIDLVWMSQVFHHLESPDKALDEIRRVTAPGGYLAIRNGTIENNDEIPWMRCFPEAQALDCARLPSKANLVECVSVRGFEPLWVETMRQFFASDYREYYDKIRQRGLSALIAIGDEAFEAGLGRLEQWIARQPKQAVYEPVDFFVFRVRSPMGGS